MSLRRSFNSIRKHILTNTQLYCAFHKKIIQVKNLSPSKTSLLNALELERDKYYILKNDKDSNFTKNPISGMLEVNCGKNNSDSADIVVMQFIKDYLKINRMSSISRTNAGRKSIRQRKHKKRKTNKKR
jgi:hypothetical protein